MRHLKNFLKNKRYLIKQNKVSIAKKTWLNSNDQTRDKCFLKYQNQIVKQKFQNSLKY